METAAGSKRFGPEDVIKEEKTIVEESNVDKEFDDNTGKTGNGRQLHEDNRSKPPSPNQKASTSSITKQVSGRRSSMDIDLMQGDDLEAAKVEMGVVREENERLKTVLTRIMKDYQSLEMQFFHVVQNEQSQKISDPTPMQNEDEEHELISLSLGRSSCEGKKDEKTIAKKPKEDEQFKQGLGLGLDCKFGDSSVEPADSFGELKEEEVGDQWPPSKILKTMRSGEDEVSQQPPVKKVRVSVRARCDTPTMNDGCQWRKYGQKIAKGNPCPRAYYRCSIAPQCPVRKQVQRCIDDMSILTTTYEGTHNHPLPVAATAMASTTSAAAYMLTSGSTSSGMGPTSAALNGLNFSLSDSARLRQFYLPNTSISASPSCPTVTLDLTAPSSSTSQFNRLSSNFPNIPRYPSTSFNFNSEPNTQLPSSSWANGYISYGPQPYNNNQIGPLQQQQQHFYQPYMQRHNSKVAAASQQSLTDTISAAVTSDPTFRSALAAAITSIVSNGGGPNANQNVDNRDHTN